MATLLLFNIHDEEKRTAIRLLSLRLGYSVQDVLPEQQNTKISELLSGAKPAGQNPISFTDEMMVMSGFSSQDMHTLLDGMRNNGCPVRLKCIVTETNKSWTAVRLYKELAAEDQAMRKRTSKK
ncbi:MAG: DUF3783 domain-containing protein [Oscillospiraceae bacterium]|nr:DUF3783 domain-containing protein [Clostridia bacterium]MBR3431631.1 DUF3783 domain-containing protein [Clostridia bacterium]MCR5136386.1 DUF3783 domain-containing protein [Oscillospiraceae bacterium]